MNLGLVAQKIGVPYHWVTHPRSSLCVVWSLYRISSCVDGGMINFKSKNYAKSILWDVHWAVLSNSVQLGFPGLKKTSFGPMKTSDFPHYRIPRCHRQQATRMSLVCGHAIPYRLMALISNLKSDCRLATFLLDLRCCIQTLFLG